MSNENPPASQRPLYPLKFAVLSILCAKFTFPMFLFSSFYVQYVYDLCNKYDKIKSRFSLKYWIHLINPRYIASSSLLIAALEKYSTLDSFTRCCGWIYDNV